MDRAELDTLEPENLEAGRAGQYANLALLPLGQIDEEDALSLIDSLERHLARRKCDALNYGACGELLQRGDIGRRPHPDPVAAKERRARVEKGLGQCAIVGEKEEPLGFNVEASHCVESVRARAKQVEDRLTPSLASSTHQYSPGFVACEQAMRRRQLYRRAIERDAVVAGLYGSAHSLRRRAIYEHPPRPYPAVSLSARPSSRAC